MNADLDSILTSLHELRRDVAAKLNPRLTGKKIEEAFQQRGIAAPEALVAIYLWHNGTKVNPGDLLDDLHFFPGFYLLSLEDSLKSYDAFKNDERWDRRWFPVFANGGGDFYAVDCQSGEVVGFILGEPEQEVEYECLGAMIKTLRECFEKGIFYVSDEGYLESDDQRHLEIARKHNPRIE